VAVYTTVRRAWLIIPFLVIGACTAATTGYEGNLTAYFASRPSINDQAFSADTITVQADIPFTRHEFFYLSDLKENSTITKDDIDRACRRLLAKKRFERISFDLQEIPASTTTPARTNLHVTLTGRWLFKKVVFDNIWFGSSTYHQLYLQQPGDLFDARVHEESIQAIKKHLHETGHLAGTVEESLHYGQKNKSITVHLRIHPGTPFKINSFTVQCHRKKDWLAQTLLEPLIRKTHAGLVGEVFTKKSLVSFAKKARKLLREHGYSGIRMTHTKKIDQARALIDLNIIIKTEKHQELTFSGNQVLSTAYILHDIVAQQIPDWLFSPDILTQQLLHEYYKKGYWRARISHKKQGAYGYHFTILEGDPVIIDGVQVSGLHEDMPIPARQLLNRLQQAPADQQTINAILDELKTFYLTHGYWDFAIHAKDFVKKDRNPYRYTLQLHLNEGKQRLRAGFKIEHARTLAQHDFFKKFRRPRKNERIPCNIAWINQQRQFILSHLQERGYWYADVQPEIAAIQETTTATPTERVFIIWRVEQGPQVRFGKAIVQGLTSVPFHRIQKHVAFKENEVWDKKKIESTRQKLRKLDVFKAIHVQPAQLSKKKSKKNIYLTLADDDPVELRARLGYYFNSGNALFREQNTPKVGASFILKNPTKRADKLSIESDWNRFERKLSMLYQQPAPLDMNGMGKAQFYLNKLVHPAAIKRSGSAYQALLYGFKTSLENEFRTNYSWQLAVGNEWAKIMKVRGNLRFDPALLNKMLPSFFIEPRLTIDKVNDHINTTDGYYTQASIKFLVPERSGDLEAKVLLEQSIFCSISDRLVLATHATFGHIFRSKFEKVLPHERFYLGGPTTVRGYGQDSIPPLGESTTVVDGTPVRVYTIQGGSSMVNGNIELRYALYQSLGITLFQDIGILSQDGLVGLKKRWYPGSGFGFRYKMPIGSLRFDVGWKWKKRLPNDNNIPEFYITFNEAF